MPTPASRFSGRYRILQPGDTGPPVPPEQKGVRYLSGQLQSYAEAELELTVTDAPAAAPRVDGTFRLDERGFSRVSAGGLSSTTPIARSRTGRWSVTAARATARLVLSSEAENESFVLSGSGPAMSLDGRWRGVSLA